METRKVQITGRSTYIISLPKKWVNKVMVKNGDSVVLIPHSDGTLLINPKLDKKDRDTSIAITVESDDTAPLVRRFIGAYLAGYGVIEIRGTTGFTPSMRQAVRNLSNLVIGTEIIDETANSVTMKDLLDTSDFSLVTGIKRMYIITRGMHLDAMNVVKSRSDEIAESVVARDDEVDKLYWMIARQHNLVLKDVFFADKLGVTPQEALGYLLIARTLERIADHASKIALNAKNVRDEAPIIAKIVRASDLILAVFDDAINAFNWNKFSHANDVVNRSKELGATIDTLRSEILSVRKCSAQTIVSLAYIIDSLERTLLYTLDIAEISINHQYTAKKEREKNGAGS